MTVAPCRVVIQSKQAMRLQSEKKVIVRNKVIGGPDLLICVPLVAKTRSDLLRQAKESIALCPDLLEWRFDSYGHAADQGDSLRVLAQLRTTIDNLPLIYTCRIDTEGGMQAIAPQIRLQRMRDAIQSQAVDMVDVEMCNEPSFIDEIVETAGRHDTRLILSAHHFDATPEETLLYDRLFQARELGADVAKLAVMPSDYEDVLRLLRATLKARTDGLGIPVAAMAMGPVGVVTRLVGGLFGSDITFAAGKIASAPGQMPIERLRRAIEALYDTG